MHALLHIIFNISKLSVSIGDLSRNIWWCNMSDKWFDQEILLFNCVYAPPSGLASTIVFAGFSVVCQKFRPSRTIRQTLRYTINVSLILQYNFSFFLLQGHEREEWLCLLGANSLDGKKNRILNWIGNLRFSSFISGFETLHTVSISWVGRNEVSICFTASSYSENWFLTFHRET